MNLHQIHLIINNKAYLQEVNQGEANRQTFYYHFKDIYDLVEWIRTGMKEKPFSIIERLSILIHGDIADALERFRTDHHI